MFGNYERSHSNKHYGCGDIDALPERTDNLLAIFIFVYQPLRYKDRVVVALTKNKGGKYDIHQIELYSKEIHNAKYPYPRDHHWHKGNYGIA